MLKILHLLSLVSKKTWAFVALLLSMVGFSGLFRRCKPEEALPRPGVQDALNQASAARATVERVAQSHNESHEQTEKTVGSLNQQLQASRSEEKQKMVELDRLSADELANYPRKPR